MTDQGILTCLDALTGAVVYEGGRVPVPATFTASPMAFGDRLLLTSEDGDTFVIKAGPTHEVLRTNPVGEAVFASPAVANGRIYIRGERICSQSAPPGADGESREKAASLLDAREDCGVVPAPPGSIQIAIRLRPVLP